MNRPATIPFSNFIIIDRKSPQSVYLQIVIQIINAIQRGFLFPGTKIPGTRILSKILKVNRNTMIKVYDELEALGWIEILPNKGTFIVNKPEKKIEKIQTLYSNYSYSYPSKTGFTFKQSQILDNPFEIFSTSICLNDGIPDIRLLNTLQLSQLYSSSLKRKKNQKNLEYPLHKSKDFFKEKLSNFLNLTRGLHISPKNLISTRSMEMSIYITSQLLISPGDKVIVGKLSYFIPNMIFQKSGAHLYTVPVDMEGIDTLEIKKLCEKTKIRMLYITSHHHYPTTVTLSAQRRLELLELSQKYGFIILEDDYDYDFHYGNSQVLPLASSDSKGMVVYIGSFGRSLTYGFRTGFVVAPENLILEIQKFLGILDRQGDIFMEYALGELIEEGEIHRHLKKTSATYKERRDYLAVLLQNHLAEYVNFRLPSGGLAIWTEWKSSINLLRLRENCKKQGVFIPKSLLYQTQDISAIRMGFGSFNVEELEEIVRSIKMSLMLE